MHYEVRNGIGAHVLLDNLLIFADWQFSLDQAILHDERHNNEDALELYMDAADWFLKAYKGMRLLDNVNLVLKDS